MDLKYLDSMYRKCPKCGHQRDTNVVANEDVCPACGLVFSKWIKQQLISPGASTESQSEYTANNPNYLKCALEHLLYVSNLAGQPRFYSYLLIYIGIFVWGWSFILSDLKSQELNASFMHIINLVFHEAGHVIFRLFGSFMAILGGSLLQLIVPFIVMLAFIFKHRDNFAASIGLWWLSQSMMDLVPYISDARTQEMWLLGGVRGKDMPGIHDWNNILSRVGLLEYDQVLSTLLMVLAIGLMILSFVWGALLLKRMYTLNASIR